MSVKTKMMRWMFKMMGMPTCEEVEHLAYDYLDNKLDVHTLKTLERHLIFCKNCHHFIDSYRKAKMAGSTMPTPPLDEEFKKHLADFLKHHRS